MFLLPLFKFSKSIKEFFLLLTPDAGMEFRWLFLNCLTIKLACIKSFAFLSDIRVGLVNHPPPLVNIFIVLLGVSLFEQLGLMEFLHRSAFLWIMHLWLLQGLNLKFDKTFTFSFHSTTNIFPLASPFPPPSYA
jgi:hypothetical protein